MRTTIPTVNPDAGPRRLLKDQAYERIKKMIISGALPSGTLVSERGLARQLDIGATPVRAAIERLGAEGLLAVSPQRGTVVRDLSFEEIADQFELRTVLEAYVAEQLAGRLTDRQCSALRSQIQRQRRTAARRPANIRRMVKLDMEFHLLLCRMLGNEQIVQTMLRLRDRMERIIVRVLAGYTQRIEDNSREHASIADAVLEGDGRLAASRMREHLRFGRDFLLSGGRDR